MGSIKKGKQINRVTSDKCFKTADVTEKASLQGWSSNFNQITFKLDWSL